MKVGLIGGGNIGLHGVLPALLRQGHDVTVITRNYMGLEGAHHLPLDYHDPFFPNTVQGLGFDALISMITFDDWDADILLAACGPDAQLVFISTVCVYGGPLAKPGAVDETCPLRPITPYGVNKALAERQLLEQHAQTTVFRLASTIGPKFPVLRQLSVTSQWIERMKRGKPVVVGTNPHLEWSWCAAEDAGVAIAACLGRENCFGKTYNLTRADTITWGEYHTRVARLCGVEQPVFLRMPDKTILASSLNHGLFAEQSRWGQSYSVLHLLTDIPEFNSRISFEEAIRMCLDHLKTNPPPFDPVQDSAEDGLIEAYLHQEAQGVRSKPPVHVGKA